MNHKFIFSLLFFALLNMLCFAQHKELNQVESWLEKAKANFNTPDSMYFYAEKAYKLAEKKSDMKGRAQGAKLMGIADFVKSRIDESIAHYEKALELFKKLNDTLETGKCYLNIASSYNSRQQYKETIDNALKSLSQFKQVKDANGEGRVYNLLAIVYANQHEYRKALEYSRSYHGLVVAAKDSMEIANSFNSMGYNYMKLAMPDSAFYCLLRAEKAGEDLGSPRTAGSAQHNIAELYLTKGNTEKAIVYYQKALENHIKAPNASLEAAAYLELAKIYAKRNETLKSEQLLNKCLSIGRQLNDPELLYHAHWNLAAIQQRMGKLNLANENLLLAAGYKDSLYTAQNSETVKQLQIQYETEKKEQKIKDLNQQHTIQNLKMEQRNLLLAVLVIGFIAVCLLAFFIYHQRKQKEKQILLQADLEAQKLKLDAEMKLNTEKLRIARDLHDNIGSYLTFIKGAMDVENTSFNAEKVEQLRHLTSETIRELRKTVWLIHKSELTLEEFVVKLREFYKAIQHLRVTVSGNTDILFSAQQATDIFRIIQEAINNALKYSEADILNININNHEENLTILISDNGKGFDIAQASGGYGIENMRDRAAELKGKLFIESPVPTGTAIRLVIPHIA